MNITINTRAYKVSKYDFFFLIERHIHGWKKSDEVDQVIKEITWDNEGHIYEKDFGKRRKVYCRPSCYQSGLFMGLFDFLSMLCFYLRKLTIYGIIALIGGLLFSPALYVAIIYFAVVYGASFIVIILSLIVKSIIRPDLKANRIMIANGYNPFY